MKNKRFLYLCLCIVCLLIVSLSIVYAALSTTLKITGTGNVVASNWGVSISNSSDFTNSKTGSASFTTPTISGTTIASYSVSLTKPGDSVTLYFDVENTGTLNAELSSVVSNTPTCTSATGNTNDAKLICDNLEIVFGYVNGFDLGSGDIINPEGFTCMSGDREAIFMTGGTSIYLRIELDDSMSSVSSSNVTISNLSHQLIYTQTDKSCSGTCFVEGTKVSTGLGYKNIEDIKMGDLVYSVNTVTGRKELRRATNTFSKATSSLYVIYAGDEIIETTWNHPFYVVDKGWVMAANIQEGDVLFSEQFSNVRVDRVEERRLISELPVYNITVDDNHNYLITNSDLLVHNAPCVT